MSVHLQEVQKLYNVLNSKISDNDDLELLNKQKAELLAMRDNIDKKIVTLMDEINKREQEQKVAQTTEKPEKDLSEKKIDLIAIDSSTNKVEKASEKTNSLVIDTREIFKTKDNGDEIEEYAVYFIKNGRIIINNTKLPIIFGEIERIVIKDGEKEEELDNNSPITQRIIKYFSTRFEDLRKEMNNTPLDTTGNYRNKDTPFDCERFCHFLDTGKEGILPHDKDEVFKENYRKNTLHKPRCCYVMKGAGSGRNHHYYACLTDKVFISKYGKGDIKFTSFQHILDAYFPEKYTTGVGYQVRGRVL